MAALSFPVLVWVTTLYHIPSHLSAGKSREKQQAGRGLSSVPACPQNVLPPGWTARLQHQAASSSSAPPACGCRRPPKALIIRWVWRNPQGARSGPQAGVQVAVSLVPHKQHRVRWYPPAGTPPFHTFRSGVGLLRVKNLLVKAPQQPGPSSASPPSRLEFEHSTSRMPRSRRRRSRPASTGSGWGPTPSVSRSRRANWNRSRTPHRPSRYAGPGTWPGCHHGGCPPASPVQPGRGVRTQECGLGGHSQQRGGRARTHPIPWGQTGRSGKPCLPPAPGSSPPLQTRSPSPMEYRQSSSRSFAGRYGRRGRACRPDQNRQARGSL